MKPNIPVEPNHHERYQKAIFLSLVTMLMVMFPIVQNFRENPDDGFPFSYYPMFTKQRGETTTLVHPIAVDRFGNETNLDYRYVARGGMNQVRRQIRKRARRGEALNLCQKVVRRIQADGLGDISEVMIVKNEYDMAAFFEGSKKPIRREVLAICSLPCAATGDAR